MQRLFLIMLLVACATASADVFRRIGPDGEVYFSDTPSPGAQRVDVGPAQTVTLKPVTRRPAAAKPGSARAAGDDAFSYAQFEIVKPSYDQGVRANGGYLTIYMSLQPALRPGHTIELLVDGEDGGRIYSGEALNVNLGDMSRGRHTVAARVKNQRGETMIETGPVGFYVLRVALGRRGR